MKILIAMMKHETNTFSPIVTDWRRFQSWSAHFGKKPQDIYENTGMPTAAYIRTAREAGAEIVFPVAAEAMPAGMVTEDAYNRMTNAICDAVVAGCDLALLDLHGAMVAETALDGEGTMRTDRCPMLPIHLENNRCCGSGQ